MIANQLSFARFNELVVWLAAKAEVYSTDVTVIIMDDGEIRLKVTAEDEIQHGLKFRNGQISYHTKQNVNI